MLLDSRLPHAWLCGCKNSAHSVSQPEVVKGVPNQDVVCFVSCDSFFLFLFSV